MDNSSLPAFPVSKDADYGGLDKREMIAAMCLQGLLANGELGKEFKIAIKRRQLEKNSMEIEYAKISASFADRLLEELNKSKT